MMDCATTWYCRTLDFTFFSCSDTVIVAIRQNRFFFVVVTWWSSRIIMKAMNCIKPLFFTGYEVVLNYDRDRNTNSLCDGFHWKQNIVTQDSTENPWNMTWTWKHSCRFTQRVGSPSFSSSSSSSSSGKKLLHLCEMLPFKMFCIVNVTCNNKICTPSACLWHVSCNK